MKCHLLYLSYNNYFNRIIKKELSSVIEYLTYPHAKRENVAFNPNDGIETSIVVNWLEEKFIPDYCIVISLEGSILSKWFITDFVRTRSGQFNASLKRDVISDHYDEVINAPCFIEKGFVANDNPLIFNKEDFNCNQIKKSEKFIKDNTLISWIVLYYAKKNKALLKGTVSTTEEEYEGIGTTLAEWSFYTKYANNGYRKPYYKSFYISVDSAGTPFETKVNFNSDAKNTSFGTHQSETALEYNGNVYQTKDAVVDCINSNKTQIKNKIALEGLETDTFAQFYEWNGKLIKTSDNKFFRISIRSAGSTKITQTLSSGDLYDSIANSFKIGGVFKTGFSGDFTDAIVFDMYVNVYNVEFTPVSNGVETYSYDFSLTQDVEDAPYGIIALPFKTFDDNYDTVTFGVSGGGYIEGTLNTNISLLIAQDLCKDGIGASSNIYDVQLLPYCPLQKLGDNIVLVPENKEIVFETLNIDFDTKEVTLIKDSSNRVNCISVHPFSCQMTYNSQLNIEVEDIKVENQCTFYRLCSPNWNGIFEFNAAKNVGIQSINIDVTFKPYQPYIHLNPNFKGLYGEDFNDARGLICGGDFSLGFITSAWETYKLQNKNYQEIFNRQIENLDTNYTIEQNYRIYSASVGVATSGAAGMAGLALGHPAAAAGGMIGVAGTTGKAITDYYKYQELHNEARDNAIDMHNYQLGNIKALPGTLTKVDAFNNNNKVFPILEKYSCTDEEKEIFKSKLRYEGMTVNAVGYIKDYLDTVEELTFVKGKIYRIDDLAEDSHLLYVIHDEISKGVYLNGRE